MCLPSAKRKSMEIIHVAPLQPSRRAYLGRERGHAGQVRRRLLVWGQGRRLEHVWLRRPTTGKEVLLLVRWLLVGRRLTISSLPGLKEVRLGLIVHAALDREGRGPQRCCAVFEGGTNEEGDKTQASC